MRLFTTLSLVLLLSTFAVGQAMVVGGTATTGPVGYDVYSAPFTPRVVTPSVNLTSTPTGTQAVVYQGEVSAPALYIQGSGSVMQSASMHRGDLGVASYESEVSAKQIMAWYGPAKKASRTYTNDDVNRVTQSTGTVKYNGKTEQIK
jgi:hypothetical protein